MMFNKHGKCYTTRFKFLVVMEVLKGSKTMGQIARTYGEPPIKISRLKKEFMERGPEIFGQKSTIHEYEKKVRELEQLIGHIVRKFPLIPLKHILNCLLEASKGKRA